LVETILVFEPDGETAMARMTPLRFNTGTGKQREMMVGQRAVLFILR